jgi:hypothetical protein
MLRTLYQSGGGGDFLLLRQSYRIRVSEYLDCPRVESVQRFRTARTGSVYNSSGRKVRTCTCDFSSRISMRICIYSYSAFERAPEQIVRRGQQFSNAVYG